jgi:mannose-6-phosphate isomerase-like protein (cupin superfamily)
LEVVLGEVKYGGQADPHVHPDLEQAFFVLQGKAELEVKGEKAVVGPEDFIFLPPGTVHRVTPLKGPPLKLLIIYSPPLSSSKTPFAEEKQVRSRKCVVTPRRKERVSGRTQI